MTPTRREFMEAGAAAAALWHLDANTERPAMSSTPAGGQRTRRSSRDPEPDLIVVNGNVFTIDDAEPRAQAFAVKNGRFIAVGSNDDIRNLASRNTTVMDAEGMAVTPGFIDAHCHPSGVQELTGVNVNLRPWSK